MPPTRTPERRGNPRLIMRNRGLPHRRTALRPALAGAAATASMLLFARAAFAQGAASAPADVAPPAPSTGAAEPPKAGAVAPVAEAPKQEPEKAFSVGLIGFVRAGYEHVQKDDRYAFVGRNSGFVLDGARIGVEGHSTRYGVSFRVSVEAAAPVSGGTNTPSASLDVRLRDAFGRYDPVPFLGVQVGQFRAPFQGEELLPLSELMFASRALGIEGVLPGRGLEQPGLSLGRQLGIMLSPSKLIGSSGSATRGVDERSTKDAAEGFGFNYAVMLMNGNGQDQWLNDNNSLGITGRVEGVYEHHASLGVAAFRNDRTTGALPNLYSEEDTGITADLRLRWFGVELFGALTQQSTAYPTVGASKRSQLAYNAQLGYEIKAPGFRVMPAYRYAYFHPWQSGGATDDFKAFRLTYHTLGVRFSLDKLPVSAWLNYTITQEPSPRTLDNNRLQLLGQVAF